MRRTTTIAMAGVGNCASSLVQGLRIGVQDAADAAASILDAAALDSTTSRSSLRAMATVESWGNPVTRPCVLAPTGRELVTGSVPLRTVPEARHALLSSHGMTWRRRRSAECRGAACR